MSTIGQASVHHAARARSTSPAKRPESRENSSLSHLVEGFSGSVEGLHNYAEKVTEASMNALRHAPQGSSQEWVELAEKGGLRMTAKMASTVGGALAIGEQLGAIGNPNLSEHEKSIEVWGAAGNAVGSVAGGALGAVEGMGVASVPLGVAGALVVGEGGKKIGRDFGGWLVPDR